MIDLGIHELNIEFVHCHLVDSVTQTNQFPLYNNKVMDNLLYEKYILIRTFLESLSDQHISRAGW